MKCVLAASYGDYDVLVDELKQRLGVEFTLVREKSELTLSTLFAIEPEFIFFPHWSYVVPAEVYERFPCVMFHMTDLPFGRGGSPLQNLIARGIYRTKLTAFRCNSEVDGGPIYLKRDLSLEGSAREIYERCRVLVGEMICDMINNRPMPVPQTGEIVGFTRRRPNESDIGQLAEVEGVYDYIRMLDADGYPHAYLESDAMKFEFRDAELIGDKVKARVWISRKPE